MATSLENNMKTGENSPSQSRAKLKTEVTLLWDSDKTLMEIAKTLKKRQPTIKTIMIELYGEEAFTQRKRRLYQLSKQGSKNPMKDKRGSLHHNYKGRCSDNKGYFTVITPHWMESRKKRMFEHQVVLCAFHKLNKIPRGFVVHHIDQDKSNNAISNLVLMTDSEHTRLHAELRRCNDYGESQYTQASGSVLTLRQREYDIVCSLRRRKAVV